MIAAALDAPTIAAGTWPPLSATGSATVGGAAAALVLATSGHVAGNGRFELGGGAVVVAVRAIRASQEARRSGRTALGGANAGLSRSAHNQVMALDPYCGGRQGGGVLADTCPSHRPRASFSRSRASLPHQARPRPTVRDADGRCLRPTDRPVAVPTSRGTPDMSRTGHRRRPSSTGTPEVAPPDRPRRQR